jgi:hypothetical protein
MYENLNPLASVPQRNAINNIESSFCPFSDVLSFILRDHVEPTVEGNTIIRGSDTDSIITIS